MDGSVTVEREREGAVERLRERIAAAEQEVVLLVPASVVADIADSLVAARERGVLVAVLFGGDLPVTTVERATSVARQWNIATGSLSIAAFDGASCMVAGPGALSAQGKRRAVFVDDGYFEDLAFSTCFGNFWPVAEEAHTADPAALPRSFESVRFAAVTAALYLQSGQGLTATVVAKSVDDDEERILSGQVINARQAIVPPITNSFPLENSLILSTPVGRVSVGGPDAFVEDFQTTDVRLSLRDR